jgi:hypothetical protein
VVVPVPVYEPRGCPSGRVLSLDRSRSDKYKAHDWRVTVCRSLINTDRLVVSRNGVAIKYEEPFEVFFDRPNEPSECRDILGRRFGCRSRVPPQREKLDPPGSRHAAVMPESRSGLEGLEVSPDSSGSEPRPPLPRG